MPSNDNQTVINQQSDPSPNVMKARENFLITGDDEMVQHIRPINKSGPQDIFLFGEKKMSSKNPGLIWFNVSSPSINKDRKRFLLLGEKKMSSNMHTRNH